MSTPSSPITLPLLSSETIQSWNSLLDQYSIDIDQVTQLNNILHHDYIVHTEQLHDTLQTGATNTQFNPQLQHLLNELMDSSMELTGWLDIQYSMIMRMNDGVPSIDEKSNQYELYNTNLNKLYHTIESLLQSIVLDTNTMNQLSQCDVMNGMDELLGATHKLYDILDNKFVEHESILNMAAVKQQQSLCKQLKTNYCHKLTEQYLYLFQQICATKLTQNYSDATTLRLPVHTSVYKQLRRYQPLLLLVQQLDESTYNTIHQHYTTVLSSYYDKEWKLYHKFQHKRLVDMVQPNKLFTTFQQYNTDKQLPPHPVFTTQFCDLYTEIIMTCIPVFDTEAKFISTFFHTSDDRTQLINTLAVLHRHVPTETVACIKQLSTVDMFILIQLLSTSQLQIQQLQSDKTRSVAIEYTVILIEQIMKQIESFHQSYIQQQYDYMVSYTIAPKQSGVLTVIRPLPCYIYTLLNAALHPPIKDTRYIDHTLDKLLNGVYVCLNHIGKSDEKYIDILYIENLYYILYNNYIKQCPPSIKLQQLLQQVQQVYQQHTTQYVEWMIRYELTLLCSTINKLDDAARTTKTDEIQFISGLSRQDMRSMINKQCTNKTINKYCIDMYKRLHKHVTSHMELIQVIWLSIRDTLNQKIIKLIHIIQQSYPALRDEPIIAPNELIQLFQQIQSTKLK